MDERQRELNDLYEQERKRVLRERVIETQCKIIGWMILIISLAVLAMIAFNGDKTC